MATTMTVVRAIFLACLLAGQVALSCAKEEPEEKAEAKEETAEKEEEKGKPSIAERSAAIGKVVEMLKEMQEQLGEDTDGEKKQYEDWLALTEDAIKKAEATVKETTDKVEKLEASMEAATSTQAAKEQELARAADALIQIQAQLKAAQEQRASEKETYTGNVAELQKGSEAIGLAIEKVNGMFEKKEAALLESSVEAFDPTPTAAPGTQLIQATKSLRTALNAGAGDLLDSSQQRLLTKLFSVAGEQRRYLRAKAQPEEAPAFVQLSSETAFLQESEEEEDLDFTDESQQQTNPEALGGMLNDVKKKTDGEKDKAAAAEAKSAEAFAELAAKLQKDVEAKQDAVKELKAVISASQEDASKDKNEIALAQRTLKVTKAQISQLKISLTDKKTDFVNKAQSRAKEKEAVDEALGILSPDSKKADFLQIRSSKAAVNLHTAASFLQMSSTRWQPPSFLQLGDDFSEEVQVPQAEVTESEHPPALGGLTSLLLQSHSSLGKEDILRKVKEMIREMLEKLETTQAQDMKKAEWCKRELEHSEKTKADKTSRADKVSSKKMALDAEMASLSSTTGGGKQKLADMKDELLKATDLRQQEKEKASADLVMYEEDRTVLEKALVVLHRVYGESGSGASGDGTGHAVSGKGAGVVGLLEMQRDNFKRMEEETEKGEKDSQADFDEMKSTSEITIMNFEKDLAFALRKETKLKEEVTRANADLASYNKEIQAVNEYIAELDQQCAVSGMSPEEKMEKRKQQLASLKEALKELSK